MTPATQSKIMAFLIGLIFATLSVPCVYWGLTEKDPAAGFAVIAGVFLAFFGGKLMYLVWKDKP